MEQEQVTKLCRGAQDKDYVIFLVNEGWKCADEADAAARYSRLRRSKAGSPLTLEEFSAELGASPTNVSAQQLYHALLPLVEKGALTAFDIYQYARFRWCKNRPEAVVACQTSPHTWEVNTCDVEYQEECAKLLINSEWGFEASRIEIWGTPYYESTDWNFICFRCGPLGWLMKNGELYQIYQ